MKFKLILAALAVIAFTASAHAQGGTVTSGCGTSPENPTAVLAVVGSLGALTARIRNTWFRR